MTMKKVKTEEPHDSQADDFLLKHLQKDIETFGIDNRNKLGYTRVFVNEDYSLGSMEFIQGQFDKEPFQKWENENLVNSYDDKVSDVFNLYFEILYRATRMKIMFYRTFVIRETSDFSKFNTDEN
jgi:hypothetical protein